MPGLLRDLALLYEHIQDPGKDQRQAIQLMLAQDPSRFQGLVDSHLADDPNALMKALGIQNARFGNNSNAGTALANQISSSPLSELEKAKRIKDLGDDTSIQNVADATKSVPALRAFNGIDNQTFRQMIPQLSQAIGSTATGAPNMLQPSVGGPAISPPVNPLLTQNQSDMIAKSNGLPSALDIAGRNAVINVDNAEAASARVNAQKTQAELPGVAAGTDVEVRKNATQKAADTLLDNFFQRFPDARKKSLVDIFNDNTLDTDIRSAIPISSKYGPGFDKSYQGYLQQQERKLQAQLHADNQAEITQRLRENFAHQAFAAAGYTGPEQGYIDLYNGVNSPDAAQAREILMTGTPAQKQARVNAWNSMMSKITGDVKSGKLPQQDIQAEVEGLNAMLPGLISSGINAPQLKFDIINNPDLMQKIQKLSPKKPYSLQTIDGGTVTPIKFDAKGDVGNTSSSSIPDIDIQAKSLAAAIKSGKVDASTLDDKSISPMMKKKVQQYMGSKN